MVKEASRKELLKLKPAFSLSIVLVGISKATLAPSDRRLVPIRPEKLRTGSYPLSMFPLNPMHPVIPIKLFKYRSSTYEFIMISDENKNQHLRLKINRL